MTRSVPWVQAGLSACAFAAALAYGAPWLGLDVTYEVTANGHAFTLGPDFPLGMLAAMAMGGAAGLARAHGKSAAAAAGLSLGAGAIVASSLWIFLVWGPGGANPGQLELLKDASRLGFTLLALALPFALPPSAPALARLGTLALGVLAAPVLLFPHHAEAAGLTDVHSTLPMVLFFLQGSLALAGSAHLPSGRGWGRGGKRSKAEADPEVAILRARASRRGGPSFEGLHAALPRGPNGPDGPAQPLPRARKADWFFQF